MICSDARSEIAQGISRAWRCVAGLARSCPQKLIGDHRIVTPTEIVLKCRQRFHVVLHGPLRGQRRKKLCHIPNLLRRDTRAVPAVIIEIGEPLATLDRPAVPAPQHPGGELPRGTVERCALLAGHIAAPFFAAQSRRDFRQQMRVADQIRPRPPHAAGCRRRPARTPAAPSFA